MRVKRLIVLGMLAWLGAVSCRRPVEAQDTLVVLTDRDVQGLDPHTSGQVLETQSALANLYEGLVAFDGRMVLRPAVAATWSNPDERTWDFTLREGVKLHDGRTLDADDVIFSLERARAHPKSVLRVAIGNVTSVSKLGSMRVRLTTRSPDSYLLARLRQVLIVSRPFVERMGENALLSASAGAGPYSVFAREPGTVQLIRHEAYWKGVPAVPRAAFVATGMGDKLAERFWTPRSRFVFPVHGPTSRTGGYRVQSAPGLGILYLGFDLREGSPFAAREVRDAVAKAIDFGRLRSLARGGEGVTPTQLVPPFVFGYAGGITPFSRDVPGARELMGKASFEIELDVRKMNAQLVPVLTENLAEIGIRVRPLVLEEKEFFAKLEAGKSALHVLRFFCWTGDAQEILDEVVHSRGLPGGLGDFNLSGALGKEPGLDRLIEESRQELHPQLRSDRLKQIMTRALGARLYLPLLQERDTLYLPPDVEWPLRDDTMRLVAEARFLPPGGFL